MDKSYILPSYPKIPHLPHNPNASVDDIIATNDTAKIIWESENVSIQEKLDGSNLGIAVIDDHPVLRNRDKFLSKGEKKKGAAAQQFKFAWNWYYKNKEKFDKLEGYSVYGEWVLATHGIHYTQLADYFYVYDILDQSKCQFLDVRESEKLAKDAGFQFLSPISYGKVKDYEQLTKLVNVSTMYGHGVNREGIVLKVSDGKYITHLFKMVRSDYTPGKYWDVNTITKNGVYPKLQKMTQVQT